MVRRQIDFEDWTGLPQRDTITPSRFNDVENGGGGIPGLQRLIAKNTMSRTWNYLLEGCQTSGITDIAEGWAMINGKIVYIPAQAISDLTTDDFVVVNDDGQVTTPANTNLLSIASNPNQLILYYYNGSGFDKIAPEVLDRYGISELPLDIKQFVEERHINGSLTFVDYAEKDIDLALLDKDNLVMTDGADFATITKTGFSLSGTSGSTQVTRNKITFSDGSLVERTSSTNLEIQSKSGNVVITPRQTVGRNLYTRTRLYLNGEDGVTEDMLVVYPDGTAPVTAYLGAYSLPWTRLVVKQIDAGGGQGYVNLLNKIWMGGDTLTKRNIENVNALWLGTSYLTSTELSLDTIKITKNASNDLVLTIPGNNVLGSADGTIDIGSATVRFNSIHGKRLYLYATGTLRISPREGDSSNRIIDEEAIASNVLIGKPGDKGIIIESAGNGVTTVFRPINTVADIGTTTAKFNRIYSSYLGATSHLVESWLKLGAALDGNTKQITNIADPTLAQDAATKIYVDTGNTADRAYVDAKTKLVRINLYPVGYTRDYNKGINQGGGYEDAFSAFTLPMDWVPGTSLTIYARTRGNNAGSILISFARVDDMNTNADISWPYSLRGPVNGSSNGAASCSLTINGTWTGLAKNRQYMIRMDVDGGGYPTAWYIEYTAYCNANTP